MKLRHYLSAMALASGMMSAQSATVPVFDYPDPSTIAVLYGDFYSFSLPILSSAAEGFTQSSVNYNNGSTYFINTANVIQDSLVVGTGSGGSQNNQDLLTSGVITTGPVPDGYDFPNGATLIGPENFTGWSISFDALREYLTTSDGVLHDMVAYFNNNETGTSDYINSLWARATVVLTGEGGLSKTLTFNDPSSANPDYVFSGGPVTLCFNWVDPTKDTNTDLRTPVDCSQPHTTESTFDHNLGQNNVAYAITSTELNDIIHDLTSGYTTMSINVSFMDINNGYENLYLAAANIFDRQVPEPGSLALLGLALAGLGFVRVRKS